jgi:hypothetical protein
MTDALKIAIIKQAPSIISAGGVTEAYGLH